MMVREKMIEILIFLAEDCNVAHNKMPNTT